MLKSKEKKAVKVKIPDLKPLKDAKGGIPPGPPIMPQGPPKMPQGPPKMPQGPPKMPQGPPT